MPEPLIRMLDVVVAEVPVQSMVTLWVIVSVPMLRLLMQCTVPPLEVWPMAWLALRQGLAKVQELPSLPFAAI